MLQMVDMLIILLVFVYKNVQIILMVILLQDIVLDTVLKDGMLIL